MRTRLWIAIACVVSLLAAAGSAHAVIVDMNALGRTSVAYNPSDQTGYVGVALVPGTRSALSAAGVPTVTSSAPCTDPALSSDLSLPNTGRISTRRRASATASSGR